MGTITKTIRIDESLMEVLDLYKKGTRKMFKVDCNLNSVLEGAIVRGLEHYFQTFKLINLNLVKFQDQDGTLGILPDEIVQALEKYEQVLAELQAFEEGVVFISGGEEDK